MRSEGTGGHSRLMLSGQPAHQRGRGIRSALLESLPNPGKQQHAAQRHNEWNRINHRAPPDSGILGRICSERNGNQRSWLALEPHPRRIRRWSLLKDYRLPRTNGVQPRQHFALSITALHGASATSCACVQDTQCRFYDWARQAGDRKLCSFQPRSKYDVVHDSRPDCAFAAFWRMRNI